MTPDTDRQAKSRERKRALGLVPYTVWILPESKPEARALADRDRKAAEQETDNAG